MHAEWARGGACACRDRDELTEAETNAPAVCGGVESLALLSTHTRGSVEILPSEILSQNQQQHCAHLADSLAQEDTIKRCRRRMIVHGTDAVEESDKESENENKNESSEDENKDEEETSEHIQEDFTQKNTENKTVSDEKTGSEHTNTAEEKQRQTCEGH